MRGLAFWFFFTATLYVVVGMIWGIVMAASGDHALGPAHAHLNLIGWVTMALFGLYYHVVPEAGRNWLAKAHFATATVGVLIFIPGIVLVLRQSNEALVKVGAVLTLLSMLMFTLNVWRTRRAEERSGIGAGARS